MTKFVHCAVLNAEAEAMETAPYPGDIGERILNNVSREGWKQWLERLVTIINENQMTTGDVETQKFIEQHMLGFLFGEGELGQLPPGFTTNRKK